MKKFLEILIGIFYFVKAENPTESEIWLNEETKRPVGTLGSTQNEFYQKKILFKNIIFS